MGCKSSVGCSGVEGGGSSPWCIAWNGSEASRDASRTISMQCAKVHY